MVDLYGKTILVTGGCGFIGSNFIRLIDSYYNNVNIIVVDKMGIGSNDDITSYKFRNDVIFYQTNIINFCSDACPTPVDYVFHFAAESHVDRSITSPLSFTENVTSTVALLDLVKLAWPNARVVHVSTDEVYGHLELDEPGFLESSPLAPRSPYAASKASSDLMALSYHHTFGLDVVVTRCCNNFGKYQNDEKFIPTIIRSIASGKKIPVYGNGKNIREWIYVDDHNKSILEIAEQGISGNVYNIGSGHEKNNLELIQYILDIMFDSGRNLNDYIEFVEDRKGHDFRYSIQTENYERAFRPSNFKLKLEETVTHYLQKIL